MANRTNIKFLFLTSKYSPLSVALRYHQPTDYIHRLFTLSPLKAELNPIRHLLALVGARIKSHPPFASIGRSSN